MITSEQVKIYRKYHGMSDYFLSLKKSEINFEVFGQIEDIMQDLVLIRRNLVSQDYASRTLEKLRALCDNEETINLMNKIADIEAKQR